MCELIGISVESLALCVFKTVATQVFVMGYICYSLSHSAFGTSPGADILPLTWQRVLHACLLIYWAKTAEQINRGRRHGCTLSGVLFWIALDKSPKVILAIWTVICLGTVPYCVKYCILPVMFVVCMLSLSNLLCMHNNVLLVIKLQEISGQSCLTTALVCLYHRMLATAGDR